MDKKAQMGEAIYMMYRLLMVSAVAFAVFGISAFYYDYHVNVRSAESIILTREVFDCLAPKGVLNLDSIGEENYGEILSYCEIPNSERFYVGMDVLDGSGGRIEKLYQGDSGALWVKDLFGKAALAGNNLLGDNKVDLKNMKKFNPGHFRSEYPVFFIKDGNKISGNVEMEVLVNYEE
ncbi:MAG: hypothetical protein OEL87_03375 [Nanoarchaeota archaeon]|nr:hypothetical protein [Nanoarchaeota archaeon]